jgi:hypothetical protein
MSSPQVQGAVLSAQTGTLPFAHSGGVVVITSALAGTLTLSDSAGHVTTIPATSVGVFAVASSGGASITSWSLSNAADLGKATVALVIPNSYL